MDTSSIADQWVRECLGGYVRLNTQERREVVKELAEEGLSLRAIGKVLGVSKDTVNNDLKGVENQTDGDDIHAYGKQDRVENQTADAPESPALVDDAPGEPEPLIADSEPAPVDGAAT